MPPSSAFTLVHDSGSYTIEGERAVVTAAALLLCDGKCEIHRGATVVIPRVTEPLRWFRALMSIDLNTYLNRHRAEIAAALRSIDAVSALGAAGRVHTEEEARFVRAADVLARAIGGHGQLIAMKSGRDSRRPRA